MPNITATMIRAASMSGSPNSNVQVIVDELPNRCPVCHVTIEPELLNGTPFAAAFDWLEACYRCPNMVCRRQFTAMYRRDDGAQQLGLQRFRLERCFPVTPAIPAFDQAVSTLSPNFVQVYAQADSAEAYGLTEIAGPGFRKALEFLIKDYAIQLNPQHADVIKQRQLASVIKEFLPGDKLAVVSSRAAWLGNDETHYERRWVGKDLKDLKKLIDATAHFIAMERLVAELPVDMPVTGPTVATSTP